MIDKIYSWIEHPELLNKESLYELRTLLALYPYFQTIRILYLKNLYILGDKDFETELNKSAVYISDRKTLFSILEGVKYSDFISEKVPAEVHEEKPDRTSNLIDAFLSTDKDEIEKMKRSMEVTTDYTSILLNEDNNSDEKETAGEVSTMKGQNLIDDFVSKSSCKTEKEDDIIEQKLREKDALENDSISDIGSEDEDESYFTETLAKIYIKQKRYDKAMEIIKKLNLKYPKKNVYFADQIRFLEKLIINTKSK